MNEVVEDLKKLLTGNYFIYGWVPKTEIAELLKKYQEKEKQNNGNGNNEVR